MFLLEDSKGIFQEYPCKVQERRWSAILKGISRKSGLWLVCLNKLLQHLGHLWNNIQFSQIWIAIIQYTPLLCRAASMLRWLGHTNTSVRDTWTMNISIAPDKPLDAVTAGMMWANPARNIKRRWLSYLVIVMVEAGFAASNWLGLTPWKNFPESRFFPDIIWHFYLYISHVHVATLCQEQFNNLLLKVGKTRSCVEGRGFKGICGIQPSNGNIFQILFSSRFCHLAPHSTKRLATARDGKRSAFCPPSSKKAWCSLWFMGELIP